MNRTTTVLSAVLLIASLFGFAQTAPTQPSQAQFCKSYGCILANRTTQGEITEVTFRLSTNKNATVKFRIRGNTANKAEMIDGAELFLRGTPSVSRPFAPLAVALLHAVAGKKLPYSPQDMVGLCGGFDSSASMTPFPQETIKTPDFWYELKCYSNAEKPPSVTLTIDRWAPQR